MTKAQIYDEYNRLTSTINIELEVYKSTTGQDYPNSVKNGNLTPSAMMYGKDDLERFLSRRESDIYKIREASRVWKATQDLKSTEAGQKFIENLENRKVSIEAEMMGITEEMYNKFNGLMKAIGLEGWTMAPLSVSRVTPNYDRVYFTVCNPSVMYTGIHIGIKCEKGRFIMDVSCGCGGGRSIDERDSEYQNAKAYITFCDSNRTVNEWLDKEYRAMASRIYDLQEENRKIYDALEDPAEAYARMSA